MKRLVLSAVAVLSLSALVQPSFLAQKAKAVPSLASATPAVQPDRDAAMRAYILAHPEVILESVRAYDAHQKQIAADSVRENVRAHFAELTTGNAPTLVSKDTSATPVTVVEFFDYRCGFCKKAADTVLQLGSAPGVRVVYKDLPILGKDSMLAAQAALAARAQGGYEKLHNAMLASDAQLTPELIDKLAVDSGLDLARLKTDMKSPAVNAEIANNMDLAQKLNVEATPTFVVGDQLVSGAITPEAFQSLISTARSSKDTMARVDTNRAASPVAR